MTPHSRHLLLLAVLPFAVIACDRSTATGAQPTASGSSVRAAPAKASPAADDEELEPASALDDEPLDPPE